MQPTGHYPIERRRGEIERLQMQSAAFAEGTSRLLDLIGVADGWRCIDLGCGPGTMLEAMGERAGRNGRVTGLDPDPVFVEVARETAREHGRSTIDAIVGDGCASALPTGSFDLVHSRFVASTAGRPEALLREAIRLARPGGIVAFQEPDFHTLRSFPENDSWKRLAELLESAFSSVGADVRLGSRIFGMFRAAGLEEVRFRPFIVGFRSTDPMSDYVPSCIESVRPSLIEHGLTTGAELDRLIPLAREHLADPGTVTTSITVVQAWGRTPTRA